VDGHGDGGWGWGWGSLIRISQYEFDFNSHFSILKKKKKKKKTDLWFFVVASEGPPRAENGPPRATPAPFSAGEHKPCRGSTNRARTKRSDTHTHTHHGYDINLYVINGTVSLPKLYLIKSSLEKKNKNKQLLPPDDKQKEAARESQAQKLWRKTTALKEEQFLQAGLIQCDKTCFCFVFSSSFN